MGRAQRCNGKVIYRPAAAPWLRAAEMQIPLLGPWLTASESISAGCLLTWDGEAWRLHKRWSCEFGMTCLSRKLDQPSPGTIADFPLPFRLAACERDVVLSDAGLWLFWVFGDLWVTTLWTHFSASSSTNVLVFHGDFAFGSWCFCVEPRNLFRISVNVCLTQCVEFHTSSWCPSVSCRVKQEPLGRNPY